MFNGYTEPPINFLPTYKRDEQTGQFDLTKPPKVILGYQLSADAKKAGRLPGYADRIFYRDNPKIKCLNYGSFGVTGNDHLPIGGIFNIQATGGRKKSRSRSKRAKSRVKSRTRTKSHTRTKSRVKRG